MPPKPYSQKTRAVHSGIKRSQFGELSEALFLTQGFAYDSAEQAEARFIKAEKDEYIYARYGNPTVAMFCERMAAIEGAEDAFATASGMAAVSGTLLSLLKAGDHVVAGRALFSSCHYVLTQVLPKFGVEVTLIDGTDAQAWQTAMRPNTKVAFVESISNPMLEVIDIRAVADIVHNAGAVLVVDNVFATPIFQRSFDLGADIVIYSATKHIDGQGRVMGGIVLGSRDFIQDVFIPFNKHVGGVASPFNAWLLLKGLETLVLRVNAQADSALDIAGRLEGLVSDSGQITQVFYPGLPSHRQYELASKQMTKGGTVVSFEVKGGQAGAFAFLNALRLVTISNNLGDSKTLITHPATTTHQSLSLEEREVLGISAGLVRLSLGLEDVDDIWADVEAALLVISD